MSKEVVKPPQTRATRRTAVNTILQSNTFNSLNVGEEDRISLSEQEESDSPIQQIPSPSNRENHPEIKNSDSEEKKEERCKISCVTKIYRCIQRNKKYDGDAICDACEEENKYHEQTNSLDTEEMRNKVLQHIMQNISIPTISCNSPIDKGNTIQNNSEKLSKWEEVKLIREMSNHKQIANSWNPSNGKLPKIFLKQYENHMKRLTGIQYYVWIKVLPSTVHESFRDESDWISQHICDKPGITWDEAKALFMKHWEKPDDNLKLLENFQNLKQKKDQDINSFINEFHHSFALCGLKAENIQPEVFLLKLSLSLRMKILTVLDNARAAADISDQPYKEPTLLGVERLARINSTDSAYPQHDDSNKNKLHKDASDKRKVSQGKSTTSTPLICKFHPNSIGHTTEQCYYRKSLLKESSSSSRSSNSSSESTSHTKKPGPNDEAFICYICKQSKPGHTAKDCPLTAKPISSIPFPPTGSLKVKTLIVDEEEKGIPILSRI